MARAVPGRRVSCGSATSQTASFAETPLATLARKYCADDARLPARTSMPGSDPVDSLVLDLLEWIGAAPRPYAEVLDAWRTSCPRLPVWEEANDRGFIKRHRSTADGPLVSVSASGAHYLRMHRRRSP